MSVYAKSSVAHLRGDLTHSGVTRNIINSLAVTLEKIVAGGDKNIRIDCNEIRTVDISGLQLLYVWMQSARFRGVEPELFNMSDNLLETFNKMGFGGCFTGNSTHPDTLALFPVR